MNTILRARTLGQSIWLDFISKPMIDSGELAALVDKGVAGLTSNPAIFEAAIARGSAYDETIALLADGLSDPRTVLEKLMVSDVRRACDVLAPVHKGTLGLDGFVSLEVDPSLAHDATGTLAAALHLRDEVDRPNLMVKIPATKEGLSAIEEATARGIAVNVTLLFAVGTYLHVAEAYIRGVGRYLDGGGRTPPSSVASFFVSRLDTAVDPLLTSPETRELRGTAAVDNARTAWAAFRDLLASPRWKALAERGTPVQRVLWASTGTKDPTYPDTMYVDSLIGPDTVNTVPPATLEAFLDHGTVEETVSRDLEGAGRRWKLIDEAGISLATVTDRLLAEGLAKFASSYENVVAAVAARMRPPAPRT